jgi:nucleoside-diphosphate-sugar epimerase
MEKILVTGGAGFLGSHLCDRLIPDGADVLCVDNYFTGSKQNIAHLVPQPYFELLHHDVTFPLYVEIDVLIAMMNSERGFAGPINMGTPDEFTMLELAEAVLRLVGGISKLSFHSLPEDDPRQRQPNIALAREKLDWAPRVKLGDGLKETIEYFRKTLDV